MIGAVRKTTILLFIFVLAQIVSAQDIVHFADPTLKGLIEDQLGITDPNAAQLLALTELDADHGEIVSLEGLEHAQNLKILRLHSNKIEGISPITKLTKLTYLSLGSNFITDISAISGLKNLTVLNLYSNQVNDLSPMSDLTNLEDVWLNFNSITDISALGDLAKLESIYLSGNLIKNITALGNLKNLNFIELSNNRIRDISPISQLTNLKTLKLHENPLNVMAYFKHLRAIRKNNPGIKLHYDINSLTAIFITLWGLLIAAFIWTAISTLHKKYIKTKKALKPVAHEKQAAKKPGLIRRVLKGLFLLIKRFFILLIILLLGLALYFQAPWKVSTLLAMILATCIVVPKHFRKWIWAGGAAVVIVLIIWIFLPEKVSDWQTYDYEKELAKLESMPAIAPEDNAATIYNELFKTYDGYRMFWPDLTNVDANDKTTTTPGEIVKLLKKGRPKETFYPDFWSSELDHITMVNLWTSKGYPKLAQWLKSKQTIIEPLLRASKIDNCLFPTTLKMVDTEQLDRKNAVRYWALLLIRAANNDIGDGRIDQALEKYIAALKMAEQLRQQPEAMGLLTGLGIEPRVLRQLDKFVVFDDVTDEQLELIMTVLENLILETEDWSSAFRKILDHDKKVLKKILLMAYEVNSEGKTRLIRGISKEIASQQGHLPTVKTTARKRLSKLASIFLWFVIPSTPQKAEDVIDEVFSKHYAMCKPEFDWRKTVERIPFKINYRYYIESMIYISGHKNTHDGYIRGISRQKGSQIIIALRRYKNEHGNWPKSLEQARLFAPPEAFIDPINKGSFVYQPTEDGFALYSKGRNEVDDNGKYVWEPKGDEPDDFLIWRWPREDTATEGTKAMRTPWG